MRCLSKKELILLYYNELNENITLKFKSHLRACGECSQRYLDLKQFLSGLSRDDIHISGEELDTLIDKVKERLSSPTLWERWKLKLEYIKDGLGWIIYQPQPAFLIGLLIIITLITFPLWRRSTDLNKEYKILEIEMELSLQDLEQITIFDMLEEELVEVEDYDLSSDFLNNHS
jgi:hypothetical protein